MLTETGLTFLLASPDAALLSTMEPVLIAAGARVNVVLTADAALAAMTAADPPTLALLDERLCGCRGGGSSDVEMDRLLTSVRTQVSGLRLPIVLIADTVTQEWVDRLAEGVVDDLIPRTTEPAYWPLRLDMLMRTLHKVRELEALREAAVVNAQMDHLTGVYNRETLLALLFRETDRVQRMKSSLCMILFDIDDFGHWNSRLGVEACDDLLRQVVGRTTRLLRSYDLLGRLGKDEFLVAMPGCNSANAVMLAERLRLEVFCTPFRVANESIRLSACFGIASSQGRSPVVVLRDAEQALQTAKAAGAETIQCFNEAYPTAPPVTFRSSDSGDEILAW